MNMVLKQRLRRILLAAAVLAVAALSCGWGGGGEEPALVASDTPGETTLGMNPPEPVRLVVQLPIRW